MATIRMTALLLAFGAAGCATVPPPPEPQPQVVLDTTQGNIILQLDRVHAPISTDNFMRYVCDGHYDGTIFHRVVANFVIQGGGYDVDLKDRPRHPPIKLEAGNGLSNLRGSLAMARDTAPDTADAEFYINLVDNLKLNPHPEIPGREHGYAVFGQVIDGMDVVDSIAAERTHRVNDDFANVPDQPVVIRKASSRACP